MTKKANRPVQPARVFKLGSEPRDDLLRTTTAEERLEMVAALSARMREIAGLPLAPFDRAKLRIRVIRRK